MNRISAKKELPADLEKRIAAILKGNGKRGRKLKAICKLLKDAVTYYDWVGYYAVNKDKSDELILVAYEGEPTEHVRIAFGEGVCGQAAELKESIVSQDVTKETNYLPCSPKVKSEIVIPIFRSKKIVGELDIDSHTASPFTVGDKVFLARIAEMTKELL